MKVSEVVVPHGRSIVEMMEEVLTSLKLAKMYARNGDAELALAWIRTAEAEAQDWALVLKDHGVTR